MVDNNIRRPLLDFYIRNISPVKINNIILVVHTSIILLSSFVIYFCIYHSGSVPVIYPYLEM